MTKGSIFEFTAPNGCVVKAIVVDEILYFMGGCQVIKKLLCYAQDRLFLWTEEDHLLVNEDNQEEWETVISQYDRVLIDYVPLPVYDDILKDY